MNREPRNPFRIAVLVLLPLCLTIVPAILHGTLSNRWGPSFDLQNAVRFVESFPRQFGDWTMIEEQNALTDEVIRELQIAGYFQRTFLKQSTGTQVQVLLMAGTPGPLVRHPPDICYASRANDALGEPEVLEVDANSIANQFRVLKYRVRGTGDTFAVSYAWSDGGPWQVPSYPRMKFGGSRLLYKMQIVSNGTDSGREDTRQFLNDFLPAFQSGAMR